MGTSSILELGVHTPSRYLRRRMCWSLGIHVGILGARVVFAYFKDGVCVCYLELMWGYKCHR
jgi:hypothetical protein